MTFEQFLKNPLRTQWVRAPGLKLYVRKSVKPNVDIELANMIAFKPGSGSLTRFLDKHEKDYTFYVESIANDRLIPYLRRRGYTRVQRHSPLQVDMVKYASCDTSPRKIKASLSSIPESR